MFCTMMVYFLRPAEEAYTHFEDMLFHGKRSFTGYLLTTNEL